MMAGANEDAAWLCLELATANHILFDHGVVDGFGHVSVRHPDRPDRFLLSRNLAPALVTAADVLEYNLDGEAVNNKDAKVYLERFIHGEIYRARPDVGAVVHSHAPGILPFGIVAGVRLRPVCHMSGFIKCDVPLFEIRCHAGEASDLLIRDRELGRQLAATLADHPLVLMRGHGMTVVGSSLRQAVFRAVYTEANARIQTTAMTLGAITSLTEGEAEAADAANNGQIGRAWDFWKIRAAARIADFGTVRS
jgi:ribulose-5-phosphate 4-epimerase/fuculose-1-phosphate aldolase